MTDLLRLVPPWVWLCLVLVAGLGAQTLRLHSAQASAAQFQAELAQQRADWEAASRMASEVQRAKEQANQIATEREVASAHQESARRGRAVADARAELERLRDDLQAAAAGAGPAGPDPAFAGRSEAAAGPGLVPAGLLVGTAGRAIELAELAEARKDAGQRCERLYEAVR